MRTQYDEELKKLKEELIGMGDCCNAAIAYVLTSLSEEKIELRQKIAEIENEINRMERHIEQRCMHLLLRQQPVATDLRMISSALKMISDMERIGDQAFDISCLVPLKMKEDDLCYLSLIEMGNTVIKMVIDSVASYVDHDLKLALEVQNADDQIDAYFSEIKTALIECIACDKENGETYLNALMIAKYFERIADHATNIAEWAEYAITGKHQELGIKE